MSKVKHERELRKLWQVSHQQLHTEEEKALNIAKGDINRRLDEMNELRKQITNERGEFLQRSVYDREHGMLRESTDLRLKILETGKANLEGRLWAIGAIISVLLVALELVMNYFSKSHG
jgi:hypothetical protein